MHNEGTNRTAPSWGGPHPQRRRSYRTYHDPGSAARLSTTVVHALADAMGVDVTNVEFSLSDSVDPDALDRLFSSGTVPGHVAFTIQGYRVTVYSDGQIVVTPPVGRA